jgi:VIT1/CCC1 family predicted Fe2+/Mn2+ transporter
MDKREIKKQVERHKQENYHNLSRGKYLGDIVYGANDGIITSFVVVTGALGASFPPGVIIILGLANLLADGLSMGASSFLSMKSDRDFQKSQRKKEEYEVEHMPEVEREEVREILRNWSVPEKCIEQATQEITKDKDRWINLMMREELDIIQEKNEEPIKHGFVTFLSFSFFGAIPLLPYLFSLEIFQIEISVGMTLLALFFVGAARYFVSGVGSWLRQGLEMLVVGGLASLVAFGVGFILQSVFGIVI